MGKYFNEIDWQITSFETDGYGVNVHIIPMNATKSNRFHPQKINKDQFDTKHNLLKQMNDIGLVDYKNKNTLKLNELAGIDPGVDDFLTIASTSNDSCFDEFNWNLPKTSEDDKSKTSDISFDAKSFSTKGYYDACKFESFRCSRAVQYENFDGFFNNYKTNMPSAKTTNLQDIKTYIHYRCEQENRLTQYWNNEINKDKQRRLEGYHARKKYFDKLIGNLRQYKMIKISLNSLNFFQKQQFVI